MKKTVNPFMAFAFLIFAITLFHGYGCSKKTGNEDCQTCKAIGGSGVQDEAKICTEADMTNFHNDNPGTEIVCD
jgi:hypothetical protein